MIAPTDVARPGRASLAGPCGGQRKTASSPSPADDERAHPRRMRVRGRRNGATGRQSVTSPVVELERAHVAPPSAHSLEVAADDQLCLRPGRAPSRARRRPAPDPTASAAPSAASSAARCLRDASADRRELAADVDRLADADDRLDVARSTSASQPVARPVATSTEATPRRGSPPIVVNWPPTQSSSALERQRPDDRARARGPRQECPVRRRCTAARRRRALPSTVVKAPPT